MHFSTEILNGVTIVIPEVKRIISDNAVEFKNKLNSYLEENPEIVLDLCNVLFIDSSGLGALINCYKHLDRKKDLVLCGMNKSVNSLFRITRLDRTFNIYRNRKEAVESRLERK